MFQSYGYAWLAATVANGYWLDTQEKYICLSAVSYIGSDVTSQMNEIQNFVVEDCIGPHYQNSRHIIVVKVMQCIKSINKNTLWEELYE